VTRLSQKQAQLIAKEHVVGALTEQRTSHHEDGHTLRDSSGTFGKCIGWEIHGKYSEVAMKRTTAGVNYFTVFKKPTDKEEEEADSSNDDAEATEGSSTTKGDSEAPQEWNNLAENPRTAESTHQEISADNRTKLSADSPTVQEKYFEVELDHDLVEMRSDTKLVLVDVPGLNEAGEAFDQYKSYVRDQWHTFDCVVLVMDAKQGVNTHDQVFLLRLVKELLATKKKLPVIVLCNKVDDPEDEEQAEMVNEARAEVEKIFEVGDRKEALRVMLERNEKQGAFVFGSGGEISPAFIPVSAINGYIQLSASRMSLEKFASFDRDLIEKLGREQIGRRRWIKLSEEEKTKEVYEIIMNPEDGEDVTSESNFTSFLGALSFFVGGEKTQYDLLKNQVNASVEMLKTEPFEVGRSSRLLKSMLDRWMKLFDDHAAPKQSRAEHGRDFLIGRPSMMFWQRYAAWENLAFQNFESSWKESLPQPSPLAQPMKELLSYYEFVHSSGTEFAADKKMILFRMKQLVCRFLDILLRENSRLDRHNNGDNFKKLSPYDLCLVFESTLLMAHDQTFCEDFGSQIVLLRAHMLDGRGWISKNFVGPSICPVCESEMKLGIRPQLHNVMSCSKPFCSRRRHFNTIGDDGRVVEPPQPNLTPAISAVNKFPSEWLELTHSASGDRLPKYPSIYGKLVKVNVPSSLSDPSHFGHLPWLFCKLKGAIEQGEKGSDITSLKQLLAALEIGRDQDPKQETAFTFGALTSNAGTKTEESKKNEPKPSPVPSKVPTPFGASSAPFGSSTAAGSQSLFGSGSAGTASAMTAFSGGLSFGFGKTGPGPAFGSTEESDRDR